MTWMPDKRAIYSYATVENLGTHGAVSLPFFRRKYRWRALLLLALLPVELAYLLTLGLMPGKPHRYVFLNALAARLIDATPTGETVVLGSLADLPFALRRGALWIPVSPLYIMLAWSAWAMRGELPRLLRAAMEWFLRLLSPRLARDGWLIVHSDGLPLARALMAMARQLGARVCCVQHGIFHEEFEIAEIDGSRSDLNIVRSEVDARIIRRANESTVMLVEPELFRPEAPAHRETGLSVAFIGEAWHTCDVPFDRKYRARLREFQRALIARGIRVTFRPHPSERYRAWSYGFKRLDLGSKSRAFERCNVFVGFASTLLAEAQAAGRTAIQVVFDDRVTPVMVRDAGQTIVQVRTADDLLHVLAAHQPGSPSKGLAARIDARKQATARVMQALNDRTGADLAGSA